MKFVLNLSLLSALWRVSSIGVANAQTITDIVVGDDSLNTLEIVVNAVPGALTTEMATVFAPTDAAFEAVDQDLFNKLLKAEFSPLLRDLLNYHIIEGQTILAAEITDGDQVQALNGESLSFAKDGAGNVIINAVANVITADQEASNGVVHMVDAVLLPEWTSYTIFGFASTNPDFAALFSLLEDPELPIVLDGPGPFTLFAPDINFFGALLQNNPELASLIADQKFIAGLLSYHTIQGSILTVEDLAPAAEVSALNGATISIEFMPGATEGDDPIIMLNGSIKIVRGPILANNGVIYVIDGLLSPPSVADVLSARGLSDLVEFTVAAELASDLAITPNMTLFAPTNEAIGKLPEATVTKLRTAPFKTHLRDILLYHTVIGAVVGSDMIVDGTVLVAANMETLSFSVSSVTASSGESIVINGDSSIVEADIVAYNPAIIHTIDSMLIPSWMGKKILTVAEGAGTFGLLVTLVKGNGLEDTLNADGPFTVFAPADAVFLAAQTANPDLASALASNPDLVRTVLTTHVVNGIVAAEDMTDGSEVTAVSEEKLTFKVMEDGSLTVNGVPIVATNILADNGIIHILGGIIQPSGLEFASPTDTTTAPVTATTAPVAAPTTAPNSGAFGLGHFVAGVVASFVATML